jgi:predicted CopG family antitoxin
MTVKTITVTEDAYNTLKGMKREDESFSDVIKRVGSQKKHISDFFGLLKDSETSAEELQQKVKEIRKGVSESMRKRHAQHFGGEP